MPRPRDPNRARWVSDLGYGYVEPYQTRDGRRLAVVNIRGRRRATGIEWRDANRALVVRTYLRPAELEAITGRTVSSSTPVTPASTPAASGRTAPSSISAAIAEYLDLRGEAITTHGLRTLKSAVSKFFPDDVSGLPFQYQAILSQMLTVWRSLTLAPSSKAQYMGALRRFFRHWVRAGVLHADPCDEIAIPDIPDDQIPGFTAEEIRRMIRAAPRASYEEERFRPYARLLFRFLSITAMRAIEVVRMRWEHVTPAAIEIQGKGTKRRPIRPRLFPLHHDGRDLWPDLPSILAELREMPHGREGYVWPFSESWQVSKVVTTCRRAAGLPEDRRSTHSIRKYAEDCWEWELRLPEALIEDLAGHDRRVRKRHYRAAPNAGKLGSLIDHHAGQSSTKSPAATGRIGPNESRNL